MTNKEAIKHLEVIKACEVNCLNQIEALDLAISALQKQDLLTRIDEIEKERDEFKKKYEELYLECVHRTVEDSKLMFRSF